MKTVRKRIIKETMTLWVEIVQKSEDGKRIIKYGKIDELNRIKTLRKWKIKARKKELLGILKAFQDGDKSIRNKLNDIDIDRVIEDGYQEEGYLRERRRIDLRRLSRLSRKRKKELLINSILA